MPRQVHRKRRLADGVGLTTVVAERNNVVVPTCGHLGSRSRRVYASNERGVYTYSQRSEESGRKSETKRDGFTYTPRSKEGGTKSGTKRDRSTYSARSKESGITNGTMGG